MPDCQHTSLSPLLRRLGLLRVVCRRIVERVGSEEVVVDYANDIDTQKCACLPVLME